ncbi:MAG: hypothetical protein E6098_09645 [Cutibacterium avidum]|nr:hypothetical protein [Cutibacterium avidum]
MASVREIGDGNLNLVFLLKYEDGWGLYIKLALPYVRMTGEGRPMTPDRARHEVESLQTHGALVPDLVPKVYFYDPMRYIFVIEDMFDHEVWRGALNKSEAHDGVAAEVGLHINLCPLGLVVRVSGTICTTLGLLRSTSSLILAGNHGSDLRRLTITCGYEVDGSNRRRHGA